MDSWLFMALWAIATGSSVAVGWFLHEWYISKQVKKIVGDRYD